MNFAFAVIAGLLLACGQYFMKSLSGSISLDLASFRVALLSPFTYFFLIANFSSSICYVLALRGASLIFVFSVVYVTMALAAGAIDIFVVGNSLTINRLVGFALALAAVGLLTKG